MDTDEHLNIAAGMKDMGLVQGVLDVMDCGAMIVEASGNISTHNQHLVKTLGASPTDSTEDLVQILESQVPDALAAARNILSSGENIGRESRKQTGRTQVHPTKHIEWTVRSIQPDDSTRVALCTFKEAGNVGEPDDADKQPDKMRPKGLPDYQAHLKLQETKEKLEKILQSSPDSIVITDLEGNITYANKETARIYEIEHEDRLMGTNVFEVVYEEDKELAYEGMHRILRLGMLKNFASRIRTFKGRIIHIEASVSCLNDHDGNPHGFIAISKNVQHRRETERLLKESETKLRNMFNNAQDAIFLISPEGYYLDSNKQALKLTGYSREEINRLHIMDVIAPEYHAISQQIMAELMKGAVADSHEKEIINQAGQRIPVELTVSPLFDESGNVTSVLSVVRDITERKQAEQKLRQAEEEARKNREKAEALLNAIPDLMFLMDSQGVLLDFKVSSEEDLYVPIDQVINKRIQTFMPDDVAQRTLRAVEKTLAEKRTQTFEYQLRIKGQTKHFEARMAVAGDNRVLAISRNITDRKQFEKELIRAKRKAEESDRLKSAFLANMSHEIRTPMNGIVGFANMLKRDRLSEKKQKQFISIINNSADQLLGIINDIIDISKLETGQQNIQQETFYLNQMMQETYALFRSKAREKNLRFELRKNLGYDESHITTDKTKLQQIINNLLVNAFKFTFKGKVELGYTLESRMIRFFVKDTGVGIPEDMQEKIFERFMQVMDDNDLNHSGTGLGLSISKGLVELLGGRIWLESKVGQGTTFYFEIPYTYQTPEMDKGDEDETGKPRQDNSERSILLVEDDKTNASYIKELLSSMLDRGFIIRVQHVTHGSEAIDFCRRNSVDLVLLDLKLPDMNGLDVNRELMKYIPQTPVIAQTAYAMAGDRKKALDAGFNDYISKPIDPERMLETLKKFLN